MLFFAAIASSAAWGWAGVAAAQSGPLPSLALRVFDLARYGFWFAFVLSVLSPGGQQHRGHGMALLVPSAMLLVVIVLA